MAVSASPASWADRLHAAWARWGRGVIYAGLACIAAATVVRLRFALPHALRDERAWSAVNLRFRMDEMARFFDGAQVYGYFHHLNYPPATYLMLWPIAGWLPRSGARVLWLASTVVASLTLAAIAYRLTPESPRRERILVATLLFASYPFQISIFLTQFPIQSIALAAAGAFVLARGRPGWARDAGGATLLAASLIKPTLAPPIVAATLIAVGRWRPAILSGVVYLALAAAASTAQPLGIIALHRAWLSSNAANALTGEMVGGVPNLHALLAAVGLGMWAPAGALVALAAFAAWAWRHRGADPWLLIGAAALVARLWAHHRPYDDAVVFLVAIALLRTARGGDQGVRLPAAVLFAATSVALLTPAWAFYDLSPEAIRVVTTAHVVLLIATLAFFLLTTPRRIPDAVAAAARSPRPRAAGTS